MAEFEPAIKITLENEGGFVDNISDPGGATNFGISQREFPSVDIKDLTKEQAEEIYQKNYWLFGGVNDQNLANKLFDMYVNMEHAAIKIIQRLVNVLPDGDYGPKTEMAINAADPISLLASYRLALVAYYKEVVQAHPEEAEFLEGWERRAKQ
jgi:lysozyme family protein